MSGAQTAKDPLPPAGSPTWVGTIIRDMCSWVRALRRGPQVLTGYTSSMRPNASTFMRGIAWDSTYSSPMVADDSGTWNNVAAYTTGTGAGNSATINTRNGKLTSGSLTTAAGASQTLTVNNSKVAAADIVLCSIANGTNSTGTPLLELITPASGSFTAELRNTHASAAFNGTVVLSFIVLKA